MKDTGLIIGALALGAIVGAAAGILLAPAKGSKTREELASGTKDLASKIGNKIKSLRYKEFEDEYETLLGL